MIKIGMHGVEAMALFGVAGAFPKDKIAIVIPKLLAEARFGRSTSK